ncbi:MAG: PDZ domain-containing protein [Planctomycetes bacterium]|nr:PDZ domain-containing protein [Planctomycetota bacterium]
MKRVSLTMLAALLGATLAAPAAWAQSEQEIVERLQRWLDGKVKTLKEEAGKEIDRAVSDAMKARGEGKSTAPAPVTAAPAERPKMGFTLHDTITPDARALFDLADGEGVLVKEVTADSLAARAGLVKNDVILSIGGYSVGSKDDVRAATAKLKVGQKTELKIKRQGAQKTLALQYGEAPAGAAAPKIPAGLEERGIDPAQLNDLLADPEQLKSMLGEGGQLPPEIADMLNDPDALREQLKGVLGDDPQTALKDMLGDDPKQALKDMLGVDLPENLTSALDKLFAPQPGAPATPAAPAGPKKADGKAATPAAPKGDGKAPAAPAPAAKKAAESATDAELDKFFEETFGGDKGKPGAAPTPAPATRKPAGPLGFKLGDKLDVTALTAGSAAEAGGLKAGDVLKSINGKEVASKDDLRAALAGLNAGDKVSVVVDRGGKSVTRTLTAKAKE